MFRLDRKDTALVVIDIQERLTPAMNQEEYGELKNNVIRLSKGFTMMDMPVVATQQYTKGLGGTDAEIIAEIKSDYVEKTTFSCCGEKSFIETLKNQGVKTVVVTGMETHVCVLQTVIDLLDAGFNVHVAADAVCSRSAFNRDVALRYMEKAGAVITVTETVLFQLVGDAKDENFKAVSKLVK